ncbi:Crp/Fnr family transcriptional regulator [Pedobacter sandarakinus]|uniref:Crp/Fnr family transcriptional regulator n=1 Tax=Pedobacter sandarakinus TaxID=353156 RepID=UPI0022483CD9|nr:Crp/Fnr family transcriptional regulator [Pedobacter sandarakinus]MCX2574954.1 Crp/Fnr family transcriptional regulator [Pedobacter sandarakinus]
MPSKALKDDILLNFLNYLQPLKPSLINLARKNTFKLFLKKNELISLPTDQHQECLFFIIKGLVRGFVIDEDKDITTLIASENQMLGSIRNHLPGKLKYQEKFQALEDSELVVLPYQILDGLYAKFPELNVLARKLLAIQYNFSQERSILSRIPSAEARYRQFNEANPSVRSRVPVKFLASYLGMRIETLSRIRMKNKSQKASSEV